ncbi:hypothetical protein [Rhizobium sp. PAMB 3182]
MALNENSAGDDIIQTDERKAKRPGLHPLHEAAMRIADLGFTRRDKTKELVSALLSHGARAWRSSQPPAHMHLHLANYSGRCPVYLKLR